MFVKLDRNGDGFLSAEEFIEVFKEIASSDKLKIEIEEDHVAQLFKSLDIDNNDMVDYTEFISAFSPLYLYKNESYLIDVFKRLDLVTLSSIAN